MVWSAIIAAAAGAYAADQQSDAAEEAAGAQSAAAQAAVGAEEYAAQLQADIAQLQLGTSQGNYNQYLLASAPYLMGGQNAYQQVLAQLGLPTGPANFAVSNPVGSTASPQTTYDTNRFLSDWAANSGLINEQQGWKAANDDIDRVQASFIENDLAQLYGGEIPAEARNLLDSYQSQIDNLLTRRHQSINDAWKSGQGWGLAEAPQKEEEARQFFNQEIESLQRQLVNDLREITPSSQALAAGTTGGIKSQEGLPIMGRSVEAIDFSQSPLYQDYLSGIRESQDYAFNQGQEALEQQLLTQGLTGPYASELMGLAGETYRTPSASEVIMPYLMNLASAGQAGVTNLGSIGQGQAGQVANILGAQSANIGNTASSLGNLALMQGNIGAQQAFSDYNALMSGLQTGAQVYGAFNQPSNNSNQNAGSAQYATYGGYA